MTVPDRLSLVRVTVASLSDSERLGVTVTVAGGPEAPGRASNGPPGQARAVTDLRVRDSSVTVPVTRLVTVTVTA
jgi:hypothetical protein